ncbi:VOC family protein [Brumimicrobium mesophilum]|uniref:VOC family protein n=1 Tax=Brumimicrobium mesophilum TaxID=392717 RepID=UPI000D141734|nr:VOC family protein [Brumimicrobium mesophilum]
MKFRYARHTNDLNSIINFYTKIIGLEKLGAFKNHSYYNGVFLGFPNKDWHIEFTESNEEALHIPDDDDLIVLYLESIEKIDEIKERAQKLKIFPVKSKNPYWCLNGIEFKDPDGYGVVLTLER